jgi:hypothetical protein
MKIGELLELTQSEPLNKIAKERLDIGEKPTRQALKKAGCFSQSGKRGWFFDGDESILEQSIYDFAPPKKINRTGTVKPKANVSTKVTKERKKEGAKVVSNEPTKEQVNLPTSEPMNKQTNEPTNQRSNVSAKEEIKQANEQTAPTLEQTNEKTIVRKRSSFDIDVELMKELKIKAILHDRNVYEIVETAIRQYLKGL